MKNNKLGSFILFVLAVFIFNILLASCDVLNMQKIETSKTHNTPVLSRAAELALWHTAESYEVSVEALQEQVQALLQSDYNTELRSRSSVTSVYSYSVTVENGFSSFPANRRRPVAAHEKSVIPFYVFQLENPTEGTSGFAYTCGDPRIGNVLALVENGDFHDTENPFWQIFLGCLDEYIDETIAIYNSISDLDIEAAQTLNNTDVNHFTGRSVFDVLPDCVKLNVNTMWYQKHPYNNVLNKFAGHIDLNKWHAGCAAVAMGQIMAYHEWPLRPPTSIRQLVNFLGLFYTFSGTSKSSFYDPFSKTTEWFSNITYDWKGMKSQPQWYYDPKITYNDDYKKNLMQIGVLMLAIGDKTNMKYTDSDGSGTLWSDVINGFKALGYNIGAEKESYDFTRVKNMLKEGKPVMMGGSEGLFFPDGGHYWVISGYMSTSVADYVWCIPGWGADKVGWYKSRVFDMFTGNIATTGTLKPRATGNKEDYFRNNLNIFTDIYPKGNKVTISNVEGLQRPVTGYCPKPTKDTVIYITETAQFRGTVEWYVSTGSGVLEEMKAGNKFISGKEYTAVITLASKKGFNFQGVDADFFIVDGAISASNSANSSLITVVLPLPLNLFTSGEGTISKPFIIKTVEDLNYLRQYSDAYFKLGNYIDLQNIPWVPISEFNGHLDGNGYSISNLSMTFTDGVQINDNHNDCIAYGLFVKNRGTIDNLKVTANINLTNIPSNYTLPQGREIVTGVITAINYGTIQNSSVSTSSGSIMINSTISVNNVVGGIAGYAYATGNITSCTNNGAIHSSGNTGGIIGINYDSPRNCTNNGVISYIYSNENRGIGGIVGVNSGLITNGTNNGAISYANGYNSSHLIQPSIAHIVGRNFYGASNGTFTFNSGSVNHGALQTVTYTSSGVIKTHNQALYVGNRVSGN